MVKIKNLMFQYDKQPLFKNLNLTIEKGNIYGLLGLNGAGKTTLLKLLTGQIFPKQGSIEIGKEDPSKRSASLLSNIFYVSEELYLPSLRIDEFISLYAPFYPLFNKEEMMSYLHEFQLNEKSSLNKLSFGQKRKFLLSFALATNTPLVIFDEPTNGLDIPSKSQFRKIVASAMSDNRTFIISTHQVRDMDQLIDPIIIVHNNRVVLNSTLMEINSSYTIKRSATPPLGAMYSEKNALGYIYLTKREAEDEDVAIDIEFLFNAVITQPELFSSLSQGGSL
ncbi:MAG: ABC transporter ATP-binding protein [Spirochaetia bacterium]|nr:ABC transporter ATP-binding protein [Spirochaetia bacterium]